MKNKVLFALMVMVIMLSSATTTRHPRRRTTTTPKTSISKPNTTTTTPKTTTTTPKTTTIKPNTTTTTPKTTTTTTTPNTTTTTPRTTPGHQRANLNGKMFTLSVNGGGINFSPPYYSSPRPATTRHRTRTTPPTVVTGWSVCLRYLTDADYHSIFSICPSCSNPITLRAASKTFRLSYGYNGYSFEPNINFLSVIEPDIWTKVCLTVDDVKNVAQVFSGSNMSIRKMVLRKRSFTGEPTIRISGFDGQVTDVQMWDYPLHFEDVSNFMNSRSYTGSILTWSDISYSGDGNTVLLENIYEYQASEPISKKRKGQRRRGGKMSMDFTVGDSVL